jgi:hypothetical protein
MKTMADYSLADLGLGESEMKVAFQHPSHAEQFPVFHVADPKHLIKKVRNALYDSGAMTKDATTGKRSSRYTKTLSRKVGGAFKVAVWAHVFDAWEAQNPEGCVRANTSLSRECFKLTGASKMRVWLAESVCDGKFAENVKDYAAGTEGVDADLTVAFLEVHFAYLLIVLLLASILTLYLFLHSPLYLLFVDPQAAAAIKEFYSDKVGFRNDKPELVKERLAALHAAVFGFFGQWCEELHDELPEGYCMSTSFVPEHKLFFDMKMYANSMTGIVKFLLARGHPFVTICRIHSDYCEHHFQHIRQANGAADNPDSAAVVQSVKRSYVARSVDAVSKSRGGNSAGSAECDLPERPPTAAEHARHLKQVLNVSSGEVEGMLGGDASWYEGPAAVPACIGDGVDVAAAVGGSAAAADAAADDDDDDDDDDDVAGSAADTDDDDSDGVLVVDALGRYTYDLHDFDDDFE